MNNTNSLSLLSEVSLKEKKNVLTDQSTLPPVSFLFETLIFVLGLYDFISISYSGKGLKEDENN